MQCNTIVDITDIAYQQIKGNYYWAQYGDFKVIMDRSTGFINATKLCQLANTKEGKPKQFGMWKQNSWSGELISVISASCGIPQDALLVEPSISIDLRGVYAHPDLIPHIAAWASPVFAAKVSKIVNAQLVREYKETIRVKNDKIDDLERKLDEVIHQNEEQSKHISDLLTEARESRKEIQESRKEIQQVHEELECTTNEIEGISADNIALTAKVDSALKRLDIATEDRAPKPANPKYTHAYLVYHKPNTQNYRVVRRQLATLAGGINACTDIGYTARVYSIYSPNPVSLHTRVKDAFPPTLGKATLYTFTLCPGKTTKHLTDFLNTINAQKKDV